jgi:hypothetical protein
MKTIPHSPDVDLVSIEGKPLVSADDEPQRATQYQYLLSLIMAEAFTEGLSAIDAIILVSETRTEISAQRDEAHLNGWAFEDETARRLLAAAKAPVKNDALRPYLHNFAGFAHAMLAMKTRKRAVVEKAEPEADET